MTGTDVDGSLNADTRIVRNDRFVFGVIDGEAVIIDTEGGKYLNVNRTGTRILDLITEPVRFADLCDALTTRYAIDREACERDVRSFLLDLSGRGIVALDPQIEP